MELELTWLILACPVCFILGFFLNVAISFWENRHKEMKEGVARDEKAEELIEIFLENADCEHDYTDPAYDTPGEHFISYNISKKGKEKILEVL